MMRAHKVVGGGSTSIQLVPCPAPNLQHPYAISRSSLLSRSTLAVNPGHMDQQQNMLVWRHQTHPPTDRNWRSPFIEKVESSSRSSVFLLSWVRGASERKRKTFSKNQGWSTNTRSTPSWMVWKKLTTSPSIVCVLLHSKLIHAALIAGRMVQRKVPDEHD